MDQNALWLFAEYIKHSNVAMLTDHIQGVDNVVADGISRVNELFSNQKSHIFGVPFLSLVRQVCMTFKEIKSWRIFLPNRGLLSDLNRIFCSNNTTAVTKKRQSYRQFAAV